MDGPSSQQTSVSAPLQLSESSLDNRELPPHSVGYLHDVKLHLIITHHSLSGQPPPGQHYSDGRAAVEKQKVDKKESSSRVSISLYNRSSISYILVILCSCLGPS